MYSSSLTFDKVNWGSYSQFNLFLNVVSFIGSQDRCITSKGRVVCWRLRRSFNPLFCAGLTLGPKPTGLGGGNRTRVHHLLELDFQVSETREGNFPMNFLLSVFCGGKCIIYTVATSTRVGFLPSTGSCSRSGRYSLH